MPCFRNRDRQLPFRQNDFDHPVGGAVNSKSRDAQIWIRHDIKLLEIPVL